MKNVVFDFGQVLVHFEPAEIVGKYVSDADDAELMVNVLFDKLYWDRLDEGTLTNEDFISAVRERIPPRLWEMADTIYYNWIYNLPEIEGMSELIQYIKEKFGVSVFLLSNISRYFAAHSDEFPILRLIDKCIFSAVCGMVKPNTEIYEYLCAECEIIPDETVFIDDRTDNIEGARKIGIHGYCFDGDVAKLRTYLEEILNSDKIG